MAIRTVYAIRHNVTGRIYIGSSERVKWRIKEHLDSLKNHKCKNPLMQSDFDMFGADYSFKKLDTIRTTFEGWKEYYWMLYFKSNDSAFGYNYRDKHISQRKFDDMEDLGVPLEYFVKDSK